MNASSTATKASLFLATLFLFSNCAINKNPGLNAPPPLIRAADGTDYSAQCIQEVGFSQMSECKVDVTALSGGSAKTIARGAKDADDWWRKSWGNPYYNFYRTYGYYNYYRPTYYSEPQFCGTYGWGSSCFSYFGYNPGNIYPVWPANPGYTPSSTPSYNYGQPQYSYGGACATLYQDINFGGASYPITQGSVSFVGGFNDLTSSMRVNPGCSLTVYQHANYGGWALTFTSDTAYIGDAYNDQVSSATCSCGAPTYQTCNSYCLSNPYSGSCSYGCVGQYQY